MAFAGNQPHVAEDARIYKQEILAKTFLDFIHPDDIAATLKEIERQLAGEPTTQFITAIAAKTAATDGWNGRRLPLLTGNCCLPPARDITARRQAESSLTNRSRNCAAGTQPLWGWDAQH